jgi:tetratricopeptide (TPR) repeat protein
MRLLVSFLTVLVLTASLLGQASQEPAKGKKPILIRDDPNEKTAQEEALPFNPKAALESITVGDFYFKRDNYKAAEERYREAIQYNPRLGEGYEKLIRVLEKQKEYEEALAICEQFLRVNTTAKDAGRFQERARDIRAKLEPPR